MEKSMVHELNRLTSSQFIGNRSTFITTTLNEGDYQLKKSRIQNLPSYRKEDLSDKLPFVAVFQTIEIQRLSIQIQALRVALKDAERQAFNASNYEVQIRQLTQRCFSYDKEKQEDRQEIDKLSLICQKLYSDLENFKSMYADVDPTIKEKYKLEKERSAHLQQQIEKWKARVHAIEISKNRELEDIRLMMESQRKSMLDRQIKELTIKYNSDRQLLQNQIRKLRDGSDSKQSQISKLTSHISRLEIMNEEMRQYEATIEEYQNKFAMISQETIRLNDLLRHKSQEIERTIANEQKLMRRIKQLQSLLMQSQNKNKIIDQYEREVSNWKIKCSNFQNQNAKFENQLAQIPKFHQIINQISRQSEQLKDAQRNKIMEVQSWKQKCYQLESAQKEKQIVFKEQIPAFQIKIQSLNNENDRLNNVLKTRITQLDNWKNKSNELEKTVNHYIIVEKEKKKLEQEFNNQVRAMEDLKNNVRFLEDKTKKMNELQNEIAHQREEKGKFIQEIDRLNNGVRNLNSQKQNMMKKIDNLQRSLQTFQNMEEEIKTHKIKEINFTKEIDRINGILNQKIRELQGLKQYFHKLQNNLQHYKNLQKKLINSVSQTQKLIHDLDQSRKQASFLQQKVISTQSTISNLKNQVFTISQQKDQTIRLINRKAQQLENALAENQEIKLQNQNLRRVQSAFRQMQEKYKQIQQKYMDQDKKLSKEQSKNMELNNMVEKVNSQLNKIKRQGLMSPQFKEQIFNLKMQIEKKERDFRNLLERFFTIQSLLRKMKSTVSQNEQMVKRNHQKWTSINGKLDFAQGSVKKAFDMQNQIYKLKEENMNLESKSRMMNFEIEAQNMKKSFVSTSQPQQNGLNDLNYRKIESTFYVDSEVKNPSTKVQRTVLQPLYFRQNRQIYQFDLA